MSRWSETACMALPREDNAWPIWRLLWCSDGIGGQREGDWCYLPGLLQGLWHGPAWYPGLFLHGILGSSCTREEFGSGIWTRATLNSSSSGHSCLPVSTSDHIGFAEGHTTALYTSRGWNGDRVALLFWLQFLLISTVINCSSFALWLDSRAGLQDGGSFGRWDVCVCLHCVLTNA